MRKLRLNIASLLGVIVILGVGIAALREASDLWESGVFTATLGILLASILLAVHSAESSRAYWLGFALFGWIYLGLVLLPLIESRRITTRALHCLDSKMPVDTVVVPSQVWGNVTGNQKERTIPAPFQGYIVKRRSEWCPDTSLHGIQDLASGRRKRQD
jgi:hypothetical protein